MPLKGKKPDDNKEKKNIFERIFEALEPTKSISKDLPRITLIGDSRIFVENFKGIIGYESCSIRIRTTNGIIRVNGNNLSIKEIKLEDAIVCGKIDEIAFLR